MLESLLSILSEGRTITVGTFKSKAQQAQKLLDCLAFIESDTGQAFTSLALHIP